MRLRLESEKEEKRNTKQQQQQQERLEWQPTRQLELIELVVEFLDLHVPSLFLLLLSLLPSPACSHLRTPHALVSRCHRLSSTTEQQELHLS